MSRYHKNTGAEGGMAIQNISVSPSIKSALQKVSWNFPVGESHIVQTIQKNANGNIDMCRWVPIEKSPPFEDLEYLENLIDPETMGGLVKRRIMQIRDRIKNKYSTANDGQGEGIGKGDKL